MDGDSVQRHVAVVGDAHHQLAGVVEGHLADEALGNLGQDGDLKQKKVHLNKSPKLSNQKQSPLLYLHLAHLAEGGRLRARQRLLVLPLAQVEDGVVAHLVAKTEQLVLVVDAEAEEPAAAVLDVKRLADLHVRADVDLRGLGAPTAAARRFLGPLRRAILTVAYHRRCFTTAICHQALQFEVVLRATGPLAVVHVHCRVVVVVAAAAAADRFSIL